MAHYPVSAKKNETDSASTVDHGLHIKSGEQVKNPKVTRNGGCTTCMSNIFY